MQLVIASLTKCGKKCKFSTRTNELVNALSSLPGLQSQPPDRSRTSSLQQKTGYKNKDYNEWLENNLDEGGISWMPEK